MRQAELTGQLDLAKRLLRYVRWQRTAARTASVKGQDSKSQLLIGIAKGEHDSYTKMEKYYEKLVDEISLELATTKAKENTDE